MAYRDQFNDGTVVTTQHFKDISDFAENANNTSNTIQLSFNQFANIVTDLVGVVGTPNVYVDEDGRLNFENLKGEKGDTGTNGTDGVSIVSFNRTGLNHLEIRLSDDTIYDAGAFVGADGANGTNGADRANGLSVVGAAIVNEQLQLSVGDIETGEVTKTIAVTGRVQGRDGRGISSTSILSDGTLQVTYTDSTVANLGKVVGSNGYNGREVALRKTLVNDVYVIQYGYRSIGTSGELLPVSEWHYLADWDDISFITPPSGLGGATQISYSGSKPSLVGQIYTLNQMIEQGYVNAQDIDTLQTQALQITTNQTGISTLNNKVTLINNKTTDLQNDKVDKIDGKGLSTNDYTDYYKGQLDEYISRDLKDWTDYSYIWSETANQWGRVFELRNDLDPADVQQANFIFLYQRGESTISMNEYGILKMNTEFGTNTTRLSWLLKGDGVNLTDFVAVNNGTTTGLYVRKMSGFSGIQVSLLQKAWVTGNVQVEAHDSYDFYQGSTTMYSVFPAGTQYVSTMLDQALTTNSVEPAYDSLKAIDYNKEYGYVVDNNTTAGTTWGKIFDMHFDQIYQSGNYLFYVTYNYVNSTTSFFMKLYCRSEGTTDLMAADLTFYSTSDNYDIANFFKVRRIDNKAEIYAKTINQFEGVSFKLISVTDVTGKTYLQNTAISNFTLHNVINPTLTNTDIDNLSGKVTEPTLIPQTLNGNELTINNVNYDSTYFNKLYTIQDKLDYYDDELLVNAPINMRHQPIEFTSSLYGIPETLDMTKLNLMARTGHLPSNDKTMPDEIHNFTQNTGMKPMRCGLAYPNAPYTARIVSVTVTGYEIQVFSSVVTDPKNPSTLIGFMLQTNNVSLGKHSLTARIVDEFGVTIDYTYTAIIER